MTSGRVFLRNFSAALRRRLRYWSCLRQIEFQQFLNPGFVFDQQNIGSHGDSALLEWRSYYDSSMTHL
jgi:hypothetical protein